MSVQSTAAALVSCGIVVVRSSPLHFEVTLRRLWLTSHVSRGSHIMRTWLTAEKTYEGFPLFLRRPAALDIESLRPQLPNLAVLTHKFAKRKPNGLPAPDYNHGLATLDREIVSAFDIDRMGAPALVETYGGERNYYFYVALDTDASGIFSVLARRYPEEKLSWSIRSDPGWDFIETYARENF
jgi:hypothetical protein